MKRRNKRTWRAGCLAGILALAVFLGGAGFGAPLKAQAAQTADYAIDVERTGTLTIVKHGKDTAAYLAGAEFSVYQVMALTQDEETGRVAYEATEEFADALEGIQADDLGTYAAVDLEALAKNLMAVAVDKDDPVTADTVLTSTDTAAGVKSGALALGYYLVVETKAPDGYVAGSPFLVAIPSTDNYNKVVDTAGTSWVYDVTVEPKNADVPLTKEFAAAGGEQDGTVAEGDFVKYEVKTKIPSYGTEYENVTFTLSDVMSDGLEIQNDATGGVDHLVKVTVGGETPTLGKDYTLTAEPVTGATNEDLVVKFESDYVKAHGTEEVVLTYWAKVTDKAKTGTDGNPNTVTLSYSNKPGETDTAEVTKKVYSFKLVIEKFAKGETGPLPLDGAVFQLYQDSIADENLIGTDLTTDTDGTIAVDRLDAGTYWLVETKSPNGYTLLQNPIKLVLRALTDEESGALTGGVGLTVDDNAEIIGDDTTAYTCRVNAATGTATVAVENHKGFSLPSTGGSGIWLFLIIGMAGVMVLSVLMTRRRKEQ